jgi:hypothetical protein
MSSTAGRLFVGLTSLASAAVLVGCTASGSADIRGSKVAKSIVEQAASKQVTDLLGGGKYKVACPQDLAAKSGASMACVTTFPDGEKFSGTATITSISGSKAHWKYSLSAKPVK